MSSQTRRRSARLASASKSAKIVAVPSLTSLPEQEEGISLGQVTQFKEAAPNPAPRTPSTSSPAKAPRSEMHPSKAPRPISLSSSGYRLGFADIDKSKPATSTETAQNTPTRVTVPSGDFTFRIMHTSADASLGPEALRMMDQIRDEARKIKAELDAKQKLQKSHEEKHIHGRKLIQPKGVVGRYNAAHMAEFKRMDSIKTHPSAFRGDREYFSPSKMSLKRTKSKAKLDEQDALAESSATKEWKRAPVGSSIEFDKASSAKRIRKQFQDDTSTSRPVSRDESNIPRPVSCSNVPALPRSHSTLTRNLMTPTKASLARSMGTETPKRVRKSTSKSRISALEKTEPLTNIVDRMKNWTAERSEIGSNAPTSSHHSSPSGKLAIMKGLFRNRTTKGLHKLINTMPIPATNSHLSWTPPPRSGIEKLQLPVPKTAPGRRLQKHVIFTPETQKAAFRICSPSPTQSDLSYASVIKSGQVRDEPESCHSLPPVICKEENGSEASLYPCLDGEKEISKDGKADISSMVPKTFTFRSNHTMKFDDISPEFGASTGQPTPRHAFSSDIATKNMPGSFPMSVPRGDKENRQPRDMLAGIPHGVQNKKRHRVCWDEEEEEGQAILKAKRVRHDRPGREALASPQNIDKTARPKKEIIEHSCPLTNQEAK